MCYLNSSLQQNLSTSKCKYFESIHFLRCCARICFLFQCLNNFLYFDFVTAVAQWSRCCATNRKVAGSIPGAVIGNFIDINSLRSHYGPGFAQPLTGMSTRSISGCNNGRCVRLTTYQHPVPLSRNLGTLTSWNPLGHSRPLLGLLYFLLYFLSGNIFMQTIHSLLLNI